MSFTGVAQPAANHPEVRFAGAATGRENIVLSVPCRTSGDLYTYPSDKIGMVTGVHAAETVLTPRRVMALIYQPY